MISRLILVLLTVALLGAGASQAQEGIAPRSVVINCIRDDATSTVSEAEGEQTSVRCNPRGAPYIGFDERLDATNDAVSAEPKASTTSDNGALTCYITSAASTNSTNCKNAAGNVYLVRAINTTATLYYLRLYNLSSAPSCSSATGFVETIPVPSSTAGAGVVSPIPVGQGFSAGIGFCLTGGGSSTDNTSAATGVYVTILYR